jgi:hypothetical protein
MKTKTLLKQVKYEKLINAIKINILAGSGTDSPHLLVVLIRLIGNWDNRRSTELR